MLRCRYKQFILFLSFAALIFIIIYAYNKPKSDQKSELCDWQLRKTHFGNEQLTTYMKSDTAAADQVETGYNLALAQQLPLLRDLPDVRVPKCQFLHYPLKLPLASIIIVFFNEPPVTLLRTLYSVLRWTPAELLVEIILVDDCSDLTPLSSHTLQQHFGQLSLPVRLLSSEQRLGLIQARNFGASQAKGEVLVFLDAHVEAQPNWLPALLAPIHSNSKTCTTPIIDSIDFETLAYLPNSAARGGFNWQFNYVQMPLGEEAIQKLPAPHENPVMNGGLFAINAQFFRELGGYDPGLEIWGAEQFELSFKIWMCGGRLLEVPCSRLGHLYRDSKFHIKYTNRSDDFVSKNYKRVAEVWMDEYKQRLYEHMPKLTQIDAGAGLEARHSLRRQLGCKSFAWFLKQVAPDLLVNYPVEKPADFARGALFTEQRLCLDSELVEPRSKMLSLKKCGPDLKYAYASQRWTFGFRHDMSQQGNCLEVQSNKRRAPVWYWPCHNQGGNQYWSYDRPTQMLIHGKKLELQRCLQFDSESLSLSVAPCDLTNPKMKWHFGYINHTAMNLFQQIHVNFTSLGNLFDFREI